MLFYIRIELDRSNVDGRSFQASTDKMLYFQGLYGFRRDSPAFLNDCKAIENTGQTDFFGISDDSSQIVVTVISLPEQHFRKNIKTRCLQNYKQRIFICRSIENALDYFRDSRCCCTQPCPWRSDRRRNSDLEAGSCPLVSAPDHIQTCDLRKEEKHE